MDLLDGSEKRALLALVIGSILLVALHSLGFSWGGSLLVALLPVALGFLDVFRATAAKASGLIVIAACLNALFASQIQSVADKAGRAIDWLSPDAGALALAAKDELHRVAVAAPVAASAVRDARPEVGKPAGAAAELEHEGTPASAPRQAPVPPVGSQPIASP